MSTSESDSIKKLENTYLDDANVENEFRGYRIIAICILFSEVS